MAPLGLDVPGGGPIIPGMPPARVLVVDDDPDVRDMIRTALTDAEGLEVGEAASGDEALEALARTPADLVLADLSMPGMDGLTFLGELRRRFPDMAVVVVSAAGTDEILVRCLEAGALDFLRKPFPLARLLDTVRNSLARKTQAPDLNLRYPKPGWLELTADSHFETVARFRTCVERLTEARIPPAEAEELRFAIDELGRNAVEWGNRGREGKRVRMSYCLLEDKILFKIEDEGEGFNPAEVPDPSADPADALRRRTESGKRSGGFGNHVVRRLMDEVLYNERGNVVVMTKYLATPRG